MLLNLLNGEFFCDNIWFGDEIKVNFILYVCILYIELIFGIILKKVLHSNWYLIFEVMYWFSLMGVISNLEDSEFHWNYTCESFVSLFQFVSNLILETF